MSHPRANGNRRDRRAAKKQLMSLIDLGPKCQQDAEGCYFDSACQAKADDLIDAHALSKSWLKRVLADANQQVYWFSHREGLVPSLRKLLIDMVSTMTPDQAQQEAYMDQAQREAYPDPVSVDVATTAKFCCKQCDPKFNPIDGLDVRAVLTPSDLDEHCRNLLFHRAVIQKLYKDAEFKIYCRELYKRDPGLSFAWADSPHWGRHDIENLQRPRKILLKALNGKGSSWRVRHIVRHVPGEPQVAGCGAGSWGNGNSDVWGCTVVPHTGGHLVAFHFCTTLPLPGAWERMTRMEMSSMAGMFRAAASEPRLISRFLLTWCQEVCLAPVAWHRWDAGKQNAVRDLFFSNITGDRFGGPPLDAIPDVNLFD